MAHVTDILAVISSYPMLCCYISNDVVLPIQCFSDTYYNVNDHLLAYPPFLQSLLGDSSFRLSEPVGFNTICLLLG